MSFKEPEGQIACWLEELAPYNFKVEYRAGSRHANEDAMSRRPCALDGCRYCEKREAKEQELRVEEQAGPLCSGEGPICEVAELHDPLEWRAQQELDPDLQPVLQWVESGQRPQWSEEAVTVADTLVEGMFSRFGALEVIHSDQGRNFESAICQRMGPQKTRTTPLHPQSDGLVERFNRTLAKQLAIITAEHQRDWDMHLPLVLLAYRSSVQESTACTPALLMLGRELRTPREMCFGRPPHTPAVPPGPEYARRLQDRMETAHAFARDRLQKAGIWQKINYNMRAKGRDFNPEDLVWVFSPKRKKGRCPKLDLSSSHLGVDGWPFTEIG
uniref:Integrase catalytic domain-containing protein n=1 Tax=Knipowitschia caucasica TaxID=637954 RepID=A0AAV2LIB8_KNICA